ncbi:Tetraspanin-10 [Trifolium repens]|nr:Tetraspanin-10 [Trifolium repens]
MSDQLSKLYNLCHCFRFIVTNNGSGHSVTLLWYKEYQLQDYSSWFLKELNNSRNWKRLRVYLVKTEDCNNLSKKYKVCGLYYSKDLQLSNANTAVHL